METLLALFFGFQLTNDNYGDSVTMLKDRFGQTHTS